MGFCKGFWGVVTAFCDFFATVTIGISTSGEQERIANAHDDNTTAWIYKEFFYICFLNGFLV